MNPRQNISLRLNPIHLTIGANNDRSKGWWSSPVMTAPSHGAGPKFKSWPAHHHSLVSACLMLIPSLGLCRNLLQLLGVRPIVQYR